MYIDIEKAKNEFIKYTSTYDLTNEDMNRKIGHSIKVMELSKRIAESLNLDEEQIELATLIGLLHDIARFDQMTIHGTFSDLKSFDHGDYGANLLKKDNFIRTFIDTDKYDECIFKAIENHNKYEIDKSITDENILIQCKIIRDSDKIDIMNNAIFLYWRTEEDIIELENSKISPWAYDAIKAKEPVHKHIEHTKLDNMIIMLGFIFDFNFHISKEIIKENKYIENILDRFKFKDEKTNRELLELIEIVNNELNSTEDKK